MDAMPPVQVETTPPTTRDHRTLWELARLFLRLGTTAFGGPAVHVGMMEDEVVRRRGWITRERFLDLLGANSECLGDEFADGRIGRAFFWSG